MINSVGLQYATALFDLAEENKSVSDYYQALCIINEVILEVCQGLYIYEISD